jgi:hypothetical protein
MNSTKFAAAREDNEEEDEIFTKMSFLLMMKMSKIYIYKICVKNNVLT